MSLRAASIIRNVIATPKKSIVRTLLERRFLFPCSSSRNNRRHPALSSAFLLARGKCLSPSRDHPNFPPAGRQLLIARLSKSRANVHEFSITYTRRDVGPDRIWARTPLWRRRKTSIQCSHNPVPEKAITYASRGIQRRERWTALVRVRGALCSILRYVTWEDKRTRSHIAWRLTSAL